jgi:two-component system cell cycle response regulator DivK
MAKVLLVEDNEMNRDMLVRRLRRRGFEMVEAVDGRSALEIARVEQPDLILLDMNLPELDGWQTVRYLKADEALRHIPVVALTAHAMAGDRERAIEAGCDEYDAKPVEFQRLVAKIHRLLDQTA